ncbi:hypothetical protein QM012_005631 [Aureobasidium pullulans]|uniref:Uncharacterized protein n=1 Tax=Aureobasidium pullulans TaxID=5580 RepID=A0ABR0TQA7_AURPU
MDLNSTGSGEFYPGGIPKGVAEWERHILNQQAMYGGVNRAPLSRRRKTVAGIPNFGEFVRACEDRAKEQRRSARKGSHHTSDVDKDELSHNNVHFGTDSLPRSYSSTASSIGTKFSSPRAPMSKKQFTPGSRHSRHGSTSRPRLPESFTSAPEVPRPDSPETFKRKIYEQKAKFYASEKQRTSSRPRHKSLLSSCLHEHPPEPAPAPPSSQPNAKSDGSVPVTMYALWRQDCDEQLKDKSIMTHVPVPPLPTCSECANASILGGQPVPIACGHSLDEVFRTGFSEKSGSFAFSKAYFAILKSERQRWHTDRFGACKPSVKSRIVADAQQLFILINDLFEIQKLRMVETADLIPEHVPAHKPYRTPDWFKFRPDERPAW